MEGGQRAGVGVGTSRRDSYNQVYLQVLTRTRVGHWVISFFFLFFLFFSLKLENLYVLSTSCFLIELLQYRTSERSKTCLSNQSINRS